MDGPADRDSLEDLQSEMAKWREAERLAVQHGSLDGIQVSLTGQHGVAIRALCVVVNEVNQDVLSLGDAIDGVIRVIDGLTRAGAWVTWVPGCGCHADQGAWGDAGGGAGSAAARRGTRQPAPSP